MLVCCCVFDISPYTTMTHKNSSHTCYCYSTCPLEPGKLRAERGTTEFEAQHDMLPEDAHVLDHSGLRILLLELKERGLTRTSSAYSNHRESLRLNMSQRISIKSSTGICTMQSVGPVSSVAKPSLSCCAYRILTPFTRPGTQKPSMIHM